MLNIKSGDHIFVHTAAAAPTYLLNLLCEEVRNNKLTNIHIFHLHLEGEAPHTAPEFKGIIFTHCFFVGSNCRMAVQEGRASYIPIFLSEIPSAIKNGIFKFDIALMHLSTFDRHGYASLGPSVDISLTAMLHSRRIIAQVNPQMPRVLGEGIIHKK